MKQLSREERMSLPELQHLQAPHKNPPSRFNFILLCGACAVLYVLTLRSSFSFLIEPDGIAAVWPASGLALGLLLLDRRRAWKLTLPAIFVLVFLTNALAGFRLLASLGYAIANSAETGLLAWLLFQRLPDRPNLERLRDVLRFFGISLLSVALTSLAGAVVLALSSGAPFWSSWLAWWAADSLGVVIFTPVLLAFAAYPDIRLPGFNAGLLLGIVLLLVTGLIFLSPRWMIMFSFLRSYVLFPFLILAVLRFDQRLVTCLLALVGSISLFGTIHGLGQFADPILDNSERIISVQVFLVTLSFTTLVLNALLAERRRADERYKAQFKNLPQPSFTWQRRADDFVLIDYNDAAQGFTHGRVTTMTGLTARQLYPERPEVLEDLGECFRTHASVRRNPRWNLISTGELRYLNISYEYVAPDMVVGHFEDVTERRQAESALVASETNLRALINAATEAIFMIERDGTILAINETAATRLGSTVAEMLGRCSYDYIPPETQAVRQPYIEQAFATGQPLSFEDIRGERVVYSRLYPVLDEQGQVTRLAIFSTDITEQKNADQALQASEMRYRDLFERASLAIFQVTLVGRPLSVNQEFLRMFGYSSWEDFNAYIKNSNDLFADPARREEVLRLRRENPDLKRFENVYRRKDGSTFTGQLSVQIITNPAGQPQYLEGFIENISERKQFENALRANEALYHAMFETTSAIKLLIDPASGVIVRANQPAAVFSGYPLERLEGMNINQLNTLPDEQIKIEMHSALEERRNYFNFRHRLATGEVRDVEVYSGPLEMDGRQLLHSIIHDVTYSKQADRIGRVRTRLLEYSQNHTLAELLTATLDETEGLTGSRIGFYHFMEADQTTLALQNWSTRTVREYCTAEGAGAHYPVGQAGIWADAARQRVPVVHNDYAGLPAEQRRGLPAGHAALVRELIVPVLRGGQVVCILGVGNKETDYTQEDVQVVAQMADHAWDIAERKRSQEALARSEALLNDTQAIARVGGWEYDIATRQVTWTEEVYEIYGLNHHADPSNIPADMASYAPEDRPLIEQAFQRAIANGQPYDLELRLNNALGQKLWVRTNAKAVYREGGPVRLTGMIMDITERKQAELALRAARDELEQRVLERTSDLQTANSALEKAVRARDEFLAAMSHELRTPLAGVLGLAQVLQLQTYGPLNDKQTYALQNIETSGQRLLELINDILDFSLAQSGALTLNMSTCSLDEICKNAIQAASQDSDRKHQISSFKSSPPSIQLRADAKQLARILRHLLGNASKFTPAGGSFGIELEGRRGEVDLTVWDTGIGIQDVDLERIFRPFIQVDARLERQYNGAGLGLALVRKLTELHGGRVSVESTPGKGSRFTVTLPWDVE